MKFYHLTCVRGGALGRARTHKHTSAYIPYLDNIEITLMKIFVKSTEISGKIKDLWYNGLFSLINSTLSYDRILIQVKKERWESLFLVDKHIGRCVLIDTTYREVYLG